MSNAHIDYQTIFDLISVPCAVLDDKLRFVAVNETYTNTLMKSAEQLIGNFIWDAFPEDRNRQNKLTEIFQSALSGTAKSLEKFQFEVAGLEADDGLREIWWNVQAIPLPSVNNQPARFLLRVEDITSRVQVQELADAVSGELQHRVGNLLNVVLTIARQTARNVVNIDNFIESFSSRIGALSRTHKALTGGNWDGMNLKQLAEQELEAYAESHGQKIQFDGPDLKLSAMEAQAISLALHELATNAVKYGALKQHDGKLRVSWKPNATDGFEVEWNESGLVDIQEPEKLGFGSMILTRIVPSQLNGEATREFAPTSHLYRLTIPKRKAWV